MVCWKCGKEIESNEVYRTSECPSCSAELHCCKGCRFYAPGNHFDCKESVMDPVSDKERANFCDYFSPIMDGKGNNKAKKEADDAIDAFNALFGGGMICL